MPGLSADDVLEDLDNAVDDVEFPAFDNLNCDYFGFRLEVYRSADDYAIVFNTISFRDGIITTNVDPMGGCVELPKPPDRRADLRILLSGEIDVDYPDDDTRVVRAITVRGQAIAPASLVYSEPEQPDNGDIRAMVAVVENPALRRALLATPDEVLPFFPAGLPPRFITLDDWCHIGNELPSENETFQLLAKAIASRDAALYRPRARPNTHWKRWFLDK